MSVKLVFMRKVILGSALLLFISAGFALVFRSGLKSAIFSPTSTTIETGVSKDDIEARNSEDSTNPEIEDIKVIAEDLNIPWEIVFVDKDTMLVTERPGNLLKITLDGEKSVIQKIEGVEYVGEGGLQGMALHPNFENNRWLYLYLTTKTSNGLTNRVERYEFDGTKLSNRKVIIENIPGAQFHDGGRIEFGPNFAEASLGKPDYYLYITTGDAGNEDSAQDTTSLSGKILRINDDGSISDDNPYSNAVYSYGHRNPQGLAWDDQGRLWSTEHGPSGFQSGFDELNLIEKGNNYGWPDIKGNEEKTGMVKPTIQSGADDTWAPAGAVYLNSSIFFAGLRGEALYEAKIEGDKVAELKAHFKEEFGRLRAVVLGPDGFLYITTSNTDGRGDPRIGDDKIIRINPTIFSN